MTVIADTSWVVPGQIRTAIVTFRLADGTGTSDVREILLLDVRHGTDNARLLWETMTGLDKDRLPGGHEPRWNAIDWKGDPVDSQAVVMLSLHQSELTGTYQPRDPHANSLEILRDHAIARVQFLTEWATQHRPTDVAEAAAAYRAATTSRDQAQAHLYARIRAALDVGANAYELANLTGLSRERIYQIRDGRR